MKIGDKIYCKETFYYGGFDVLPYEHNHDSKIKNPFIVFEKDRYYIITSFVGKYYVNISFDNGNNRFIEQFNFYSYSHACKIYIQNRMFKDYFLTIKQYRKLKLKKINENL